MLAPEAEIYTMSTTDKLLASIAIERLRNGGQKPRPSDILFQTTGLRVKNETKVI